MNERLPTGLWIEAKLRELDRKAISYYVVHKGAYYSGTVLLKINSLSDGCRVLTQIREQNGEPGWLEVFKSSFVVESKADAYIQRSIQRDPDIWAIEIENRTGENSFEE